MATINPITGRRQLQGFKPPIPVVARPGDASYGGPTSGGGSFIKSQDGGTGVTSLQVKDAQGNIITNTVGGRSTMGGNKPALPNTLPSTGARTQASGTKDNSAVIDTTGGVINTFPQGGDAGLPAPTVATPNNPVILRTKAVSNVGYKPVDHTDIDSMDLVGLRDYTRSLQYDQAQGKSLTKEQTLKMQRAMDRASELGAPQSQVATGALDQLQATQQQQKETAKTELQAQDQQQLQATQQLEQAKLEAIRAENAQAEEKQKKTLGYILGAQGAGTSSYGAEKINEITSYFNAQNQLAILESTANIEKMRAEQAGATRQELSKYDDKIFKLQETKAKYQIESAIKVDEYNQENAQGVEKSLQNILDVAMAQEADKIPLTDAEKAEVQAYGQLLIDEKGGINKEMLDIIPARLRNQALIVGSAVKGAVPKEPKTLNTNGGAFVYDYTTQTRKKLAGSVEEKRGNWQQLDDGTLLNKDTGDTRTITGTGSIQSAIQRAIDVCKTGAQCGRFINEVGKQAGVNLNIKNSYQSKVDAVNSIGQAMTMNDIGAGSIFAYPTGTEYGHIGIVTGVNGDGTINIMDYNYNNDEQQRERMNVDPAEIMNIRGVISKPLITNDNAQQGGVQEQNKKAILSAVKTGNLTNTQRESYMKQALKEGRSDEFIASEGGKYDSAKSSELTKNVTGQPFYKDMTDISRGYDTIQGIYSDVANAGGLQDISAINALQRMIDPGATVREGDVALIQKAVPYFKKIDPNFQWNKFKDGDVLPVATRNKLISTARGIYEAQAKGYNANVEKLYGKKAVNAGTTLSDEGLLFDIGQTQPTAEPQSKDSELDALLGI